MKEKIQLMLVDDHQIVLDGVAKMLDSQQRFEVQAKCLSAKEALCLLVQQPNIYDIVVVDISMPIMNGIELCREIKEKNPATKVLVLSMHNNIALVKDAINANADGYMLKNIRQEEFLAGLESVVDDGSYFSKEILPFLFRQAKSNNSAINFATLSKREIEILELIVNEFTSKQIAEKLYISKQTVDTHRNNIMQKTQSKSIVGLIKYAYLKGILSI